MRILRRKGHEVRKSRHTGPLPKGPRHHKFSINSGHSSSKDPNPSKYTIYGVGLQKEPTFKLVP